MFVLGITDTLEAIASVADKVSYNMSYVDGTTVETTQGLVGSGQTTLHTAAATTRVLSVSFSNTHTSAVTVTLSKDPTDAGTLYHYFETISLGVKHTLVFDGQRITVTDANGTLITGSGTIIATDTIWDAAGDTVYGTGANTAAKLAAGAADLKKFMNAAGTAPEWAGGLKIGTFTIDTATATGSQAISGVGFKPSHIILLIDIAGTKEFSVGFDDGTNHYSVNDNSASTANTYGTQVDWSMILYQSEGVNYLGLVSVLGADGFTVSWTKNGAKTGTATIFYLAFR